MPSHRADTRVVCRRRSLKSKSRTPGSASPRRAARAQLTGPSRRARYTGIAARAGIVTVLGLTTIVVPAAGEVPPGRSGAAEAAATSRTQGHELRPAGPQPAEQQAQEPAEAAAGLSPELRALPQEESSRATPPLSLRRPDDVPEQNERVSRAQERPVLPGCDGTVGDSGAPNGRLGKESLCVLWDADHLLRPDAAVAAAELNLAYRAQFGTDLCITDSYRSLASQQSLHARKPGLAARPGTSEHGWGMAIDLCGGVETGAGAQFDWLGENAPGLGWHNPDWARAGGQGRYEPWHWEFTPPAG